MSDLRRKLHRLLYVPQPEGSEPLLLLYAVMFEYIGIVSAMYYRTGQEYQRVVDWCPVSNGRIMLTLANGGREVVKSTGTVYCVPPARKESE